MKSHVVLHNGANSLILHFYAGDADTSVVISWPSQRSWVGATKKQRDELLDFIRHLAEDDKEGVMAVKVNYVIKASGVLFDEV